MKYERKVMFKCDHCNKNITDKKHVRILMGSSSGWMIPPFIAGLPVVSLSERKPEYHFDIPECFAAYFVEKLYAIRTNTRRYEIKNTVASISGGMLEEISTERSRVQREDNMGTCDIVQGKEDKRDMGNSVPMLVVALGHRDGKEDQRVDSIKQDDEERRKEISSFRLGAKKILSKLIVWAITTINVAKI